MELRLNYYTYWHEMLLFLSAIGSEPPIDPLDKNIPKPTEKNVGWGCQLFYLRQDSTAFVIYFPRPSKLETFGRAVTNL